LAVCEVAGCGSAAQLFVKGYAVCDLHGDAVIDSLREEGQSVSRASVATVQAILLRLANGNPPRRTVNG
jgi:hypothetical protein